MATISTVAASDTLDTWRTTLNTTIGRWNVLGESSDITITGGNIDSTVIGDSTAAAGTFTNLTVTSTADLTSSTVLFADDSISGNKISGGTAEVTQVILSADPSLSTHAATKSYVDAQITGIEADIIAFAIIFGG